MVMSVVFASQWSWVADAITGTGIFGCIAEAFYLFGRLLNISTDYLRLNRVLLISSLLALATVPWVTSDGCPRNL
jgi:hypothetical protein